MSLPKPTSSRADIRRQLRDAIAHFEHVLPGQAPLRDFVHHNTLHGFQHLSFPKALEAAHELTGARGYLPEEQFRELFHQGRITREDLLHVLEDDTELAAGEVISQTERGTVQRSDVYLTALVYPLKPVTGCQLNWQIEELSALQAFQPDVADENRRRLLQAARAHRLEGEATAIADLWSACLAQLGLEHYLFHPEELLDLSPEQAEQMLAQLVDEEGAGPSGQPMVHRLMRKEAEQRLETMLGRVGHGVTRRDVLQALTGRDLLEELRPLLIRHLAAYLDQGLAAWHSDEREQGFYAAWRRSAIQDLVWIFEDLPGWSDSLHALPDDPLEVVMSELERLGLPRPRWIDYLERLALELPGWAGMFLWRHLHPGYEDLHPQRVEMLDYLAVRLVLERLFAQRLCREQWQIEASLDLIRWYFRRHLAEFLVRWTLYNARLPEYLISLAQRLVNRPVEQPPEPVQWNHLAHLIWTWRQSPSADRLVGYSVLRSAWPLFRLAQHLGLCGADIRRLRKAQLKQVFDCLHWLVPARAGNLWLQAYELHYREQLFNALVNNHGRGRWLSRDHRPEAQVIFCMDDREESIRRHLEETHPDIETLGAAGFFGVAINWRALDDERVTPLCPVVVTPAHEVREIPQPGTETLKGRHDRRHGWRIWLKNLLYQETRRNLLSATVMIALAAPAALVVLATKVLAPLSLGRLSERLRAGVDLHVPTQVAINAADERPATPEQPRLGFTDTEQADRVQGFLRTIGLASGLAPLVVLMGHGSSSQNNPHLAAYDCGACSGRHGGPNARTFAAMANRPEVRALLRKGRLDIPDDTWFVGAEHNTCDDSILWYDIDSIPEPLRPQFETLRVDLDQASRGSAHERCRRFASAPEVLLPDQTLRHVLGRSRDFSQARPELGHATNAAAFIGRRSMSQGAFFDRRVFLISYDPTQDPQGQVLEAILLATGPVGAGINLEYYFCTVNNERYGSGSKVTHNVTGLLGVMDGASSDLRTGLPQQMIEVHEAMRLQIVVEASTEVLTRIYERQPILQELIGNGWILLSAKDPESEAIAVFKPQVGFVPWEGEVTPLPTVARSTEWYSGHHGPLAPALLEEG